MQKQHKKIKARKSISKNPSQWHKTNSMYQNAKLYQKGHFLQVMEDCERDLTIQTKVSSAVLSRLLFLSPTCFIQVRAKHMFHQHNPIQQLNKSKKIHLQSYQLKQYPFLKASKIDPRIKHTPRDQRFSLHST